MNECPTCRARALIEASQREEIEHLRIERENLRAMVVAQENKTEEVVAMLIAEATH